LLVILSNNEYLEIVHQLYNIPPHITGKQRQTYKRNLKNKLTKHKYASKYEPFKPLPYFINFVTRETSREALRQILQTAATATTFTLDTQSVNIYRKGTRPTPDTNITVK
jgi:hypothetical protein